MGLLVAFAPWLNAQVTPGAQVTPSTETEASRRIATLEVYYEPSNPEQRALVAAAEQFATSREGIRLRLHDLEETASSEEARAAAHQRLDKICAAGRLSAPQLPLFYGSNTIIHAMRDGEDLTRRLRNAFRIDVYTRIGCSRCAEAKTFIGEIKDRYPAFEFRYLDITTDRAHLDALNQLVARYRKAATSTPVFHMFNQLVVGFDSPATSGRRLTELLDKWTVPERQSPPAPTSPSFSEAADRDKSSSYLRSDPRDRTATRLVRTYIAWCTLVQYATMAAVVQESPEPRSAAIQDELPLPDVLPLDDDLPRDDDLPLPGSGEPSTAPTPTIDLPWLGRITVRDWGMPLFTTIVGLVDGFNPCAMWVLLFLLSILVNLHSRRRILLVAGTFVLISGIVYFAFMAAWLNVFLLVGYLRPVQISLAVIAILVGSIHIKDFFAFKKGISLSIPDSAKPGIYQRVRAIVNAENLFGAMIGVSVLALLVNIVELLCTAGLPALYTEILTQQGYPPWENYAYLALYNVAYMFDDGVMVAAVVLTLEKTKLQEHQGRWLKLISGVAIVALGILMLLRPEWLF